MRIIHHEQLVRETYHNQLVRELYIIRKIISDAIYPGKKTDMIFMTSMVSKRFSSSIGFAHAFVFFLFLQKSCPVSSVFVSPAKPLKHTYKKTNKNIGPQHRPAGKRIVVQTLVVSSTSPNHLFRSNCLFSPLFSFDTFPCCHPSVEPRSLERR